MFSRLALLLGIFSAGTLHASVLFTVIESGGNVVVSGSGSVNLSALSLGSSGSTQSLIRPEVGLLRVGASGLFALYSGVTGPADIGTGGIHVADSGTGDLIGITNGAFILLPAGYVSGTPLSGTSTFNGATFASLGLATGTYFGSWGSGPTADSFTVQIVPTSAVPEPTAFAMLAAAGLALLPLRRRLRA